MRLFVPKNNERMITKKKKKEKNDQGVGSSRNHLSTFLYLRYGNAITFLHPFYILLLYKSLRPKNPETIVIVSTGRSNIGLL